MATWPFLLSPPSQMVETTPMFPVLVHVVISGHHLQGQAFAYIHPNCLFLWSDFIVDPVATQECFVLHCFVLMFQWPQFPV